MLSELSIRLLNRIIVYTYAVFVGCALIDWERLKLELLLVSKQQQQQQQ